MRYLTWTPSNDPLNGLKSTMLIPPKSCRFTELMLRTMSLSQQLLLKNVQEQATYVFDLTMVPGDPKMTMPPSCRSSSCQLRPRRRKNKKKAYGGISHDVILNKTSLASD